MLFFSPLEQFKILNILIIGNIALTNFLVFLILALVCFGFISFCLMPNNKNFYIIPSRIQAILETLYKVVFSLLQDNVGNVGKNFFPFLFTLFIFILSLNLIGLIPYSFAVTSHLIVTFTLALTTFIGINIICINKHGINILSLFLPAGSSFFLALLLVPIEIISYLFRPISLSVRLFANIMAGHTLLKVIAGFA
jgi:ATP synthase subunit 6